MALESIGAGSTIASLDPSNPVGGDAIAQGDNHIRNVKLAVQQTFMNLSATVSAVAAELDIAHKGGTISGNVTMLGALTANAATILGGLTVSQTAVFKSALSVGGAMSVGGLITGQVTSANFANSASKALFANSASFAHSASRAGFASSASFAHSASGVNSLQPFAITIDLSGTSNFNPNSLTSTRQAQGSYQITHNFGTTNYAVQATPASNVRAATVGSIGSNTVVINTFNFSSFFTDSPIHVYLVR